LSSRPRRSLFSERDGRLFLAAQALDSTAIGIAGVALPWFVLARGGSITVAGLIYPLSIVPYVVFGLPAGRCGDRRHWRTVIGLSHAVQALAASVIPIWALSGVPPIWVALLAAFTVGCARVFADAAAFGAVASVVGTEQFVRGQSALSAAWSIGALVGPPVAGALVTWLGPARALAGEAAVFVLATALVALVRSRPSPSGSGPTAAPPGLTQGLAFILRDRPARVYTLTSVGFAFAVAGVAGLEIPLLRNTVGLSGAVTGWILGAGAIAGTAAALVAPSADHRLGTGALCTIGLVLAPLAILGLAAAQTVGEALVAFCAQAALTWGLSTIFISARQSRGPARLQARVGISGRMVLLGFAAIGATLASALSGSVPLRDVYVAMAGASIAVALVAIPAINRLRRIR
jgi:Major Facilitator Superfamily